MSRTSLLLVALAAACGDLDPGSPVDPDSAIPPVGEPGGAAAPADGADLGAPTHDASSSRAAVSGSLDSGRASMRSDRFHLEGALRVRAD